MTKITKKSIEANLQKNKDGSIRKVILTDMINLFHSIKPNEKVHYISYTGRGRSTHTIHSIDTSLLSKFTTYTKGNDAPRGGICGTYILLNTKEYKNLLKRLSYFIDVDGLLNEIKLKKQREIDEIENRRLNEMKKRKFFIGNKKTDDISIIEWINLPSNFKHPAPQKVYDLKQESGMGWKEFEEYLKSSIETVA